MNLKGVQMDSFVCKFVVLENKEQRILKPRKFDEKNNLNRFTKLNSVKKCLFGVASSVETEKMLQEQYAVDKKRFLEKFGIDISEIENLENEETNENNVNGHLQVSKKCVTARRILKGQRKVFKPHNSQAVITDFYQARKNVQSSDKFSNESKEN